MRPLIGDKVMTESKSTTLCLSSTDLRFGFEQVGDFGFADHACSDNKTAATGELEEHGEEPWRKSLHGFYLAESGLRTESAK